MDQRDKQAHGAVTAAGDALYWSRMNTQAFLSIPPPLRPSAEDLDNYRRLSGRWQGAGRAPRLLVLGCTPDFWRLPLPEGTQRLAIDRSTLMLEHLWPGGSAHGMHADWSELPVADASQDLVFCDGGFTLLDFPGRHRIVAAEIARVLSTGGLLLLRVHPRPSPAEQPDTVMAQFLAGRVANSSELKLRLAAALCADPRAGTALDQVWQVFERGVQEFDGLPQACGWPQQDIDRMRRYAGCMDRYTFPTLDEQLGIFAAAGSPFTLLAVERPGGKPGFSSPILALQRA